MTGDVKPWGRWATLGLGRPARNKIFPVISVVIAYLPAVVFIGIAVLIPSDILEPEEVADYPGYYGFIILAIVLFTALVAPEVLVSDRRNGMLAMYLSTPLDRRTYLVAKAVAVAAMLGLVTLLPPVLMLIGYSVENAGPDGLGDWLLTLGRIVLSGVAISAALAAVSMAASSLTDRRAFAAIGIVLLVLASPILAAALVDGAELSPSWRLIDISSVPFELVFRIFDSRRREMDSRCHPPATTTSVTRARTSSIVARMATMPCMPAMARCAMLAR